MIRSSAEFGRRPGDSARPRSRLRVIAGLVGLMPALLAAQWSAQPGERVRNAFGPGKGDAGSVCRGACGLDCPSACEKRIAYECADAQRLLRVTSYECGTHLGCREHDDCLDRCSQRGGLECQAQCHGEAIQRFGLERATSWASGGGPHDGPPITFEYTRATARALEPVFACPEGSRLACSGAAGSCLRSDGSPVEPVFDSYPGATADAMRISSLRVGSWCGERVCGHAPEIEVTGGDTCAGAGATTRCTRYGMEFDYRGADPAAPLECSSSKSGGRGDFVGDLIKRSADSMPQHGEGSARAGGGLGELLGVLQKVVASADSPEEVEFSFAPFGPDGKPIESQRVGSQSGSAPRAVPRTVGLDAASGRLVVPLHELAGSPGPPRVEEREIRCTHRGVPVLETTVRLRFSD